MSFNVKDGHGAHALDLNTLLDQLRGYGVVSGGTVTAAPTSGDHVVAIDETTVYTGEIHTIPAQEIDLEPHVDNADPLKALIFVSADGRLEVLAGAPEDPRPSNVYRWDTYRPAPPDLSSEDGVPLAEVWLSPDDPRTTTDDINPRSVSANIEAHELTGETVNFSEIIDGAGVSHTGELADLDTVFAEDDILDTVNNDPYHGTAAQHNYFSGSHADLANVLPDQHHPRFDNEEARAAIRGVVDAADLAAGSGTTGQHLEYRSTGLVWSDPPGQRAEELASGTVTHTGGSSTPVLIAGVTADELAEFDLSVGVGADPGWSGGYSFEYDYSHVWNDTTGEIDIELTLSWTTDPGVGNDLTLSWTAWNTAPAVVDGRWTDTDTINAINGSTIEPASAIISDRLKGPVVDDPGSIPSPEIGYLAIASGNGPVPFGQYVHNDEEWVGPLGTSVSALSEINIDVAKSWNGHPILDLGAPTNPTDGARLQELTEHAAIPDAHHAKTESADIDHAGVSNVRPDQHHSRPDTQEIVGTVSGKVHTHPLTASSIPSGEYLRNYVSVNSDETFKLVRASFFDNNGNTPTGLTLQVYNRNTDTVVYDQTTKLRRGTADSPLVSVSGSADIEIRIRNNTSTTKSVGGTANFYY